MTSELNNGANMTATAKVTIHTHLRKSLALTVAEIAKATGIKRGTVRSALRQLEEERTVYRLSTATDVRCEPCSENDSDGVYFTRQRGTNTGICNACCAGIVLPKVAIRFAAEA